MKPMKGAIGFSKWLLRLAPAFIISYQFLEDILTWDFTEINYLLKFGLAVFSLLLIIGGFSRKHGLTIISGLLIAILAIVLLILNLDDVAIFTLSILFFVLGFFFVTNGNKST